MLYTEINSKLNVGPETIQCLAENISSKLSDIDLSNIFGYVSSGKQTNKNRSRSKTKNK